MSEIYLTNSLTRKKEKFVPIIPGQVGIYTCGPTVYDYASIGNFRTYMFSDVLVRLMKHSGYKVNYVMNLTDVGHLTGDNLGDADTGEDRMEKSAKKEGKNAWEIANFYIDAFKSDFQKLNLTEPEVFARATENIKEQIKLIKQLEDKTLTYKIEDGIYFNTVAFEEKTGRKYGELSTLDEIKEGSRVELNPGKKNPRDFALWKFSPKGQKRQMEWESPWGVGFPGWHIECSAMSMKYLGETFDIHIGGEDLRSTHHPNEIAQSEGATGKEFVKYWLHGIFLKVDGQRMGKSLGNFYTVPDIEGRGFEPLALRYLYLTAHYRDSLNFTWQSLESAQNALQNLRLLINSSRLSSSRAILSEEKGQKVAEFRDRFDESLSDDLNTPKALAVLWEALKSSIPSQDKYDLAANFDDVLGLALSKGGPEKKSLFIPREVKRLLVQREELRKSGKWQEADEVRAKIYSLGYKLEDTPKGQGVKKV